MYSVEQQRFTTNYREMEIQEYIQKILTTDTIYMNIDEVYETMTQGSKATEIDATARLSYLLSEAVETEQHYQRAVNFIAAFAQAVFEFNVSESGNETAIEIQDKLWE